MNRTRGISAFALKMAAIVGMSFNHVANVFGAVLPDWLAVATYTLGGLTFPIMGYLLCEGYRHTSNVARYAWRLAVFAAISQVPFSLLFGATGNVLFTLLIGLGLLWARDYLVEGARNLSPQAASGASRHSAAKGSGVFPSETDSRSIVAGGTQGTDSQRIVAESSQGSMLGRLIYWLLVVVGIAASSLCDWGVVGPIMILLFWHMHDRPRGVALAMLVPMLALGLPALSWALANPTTLSLGAVGYYTVGFGLATLLMLNYNGQRGRPMKWFFYAYYPAHLLALWALTFVLLPQ